MKTVTYFSMKLAAGSIHDIRSYVSIDLDMILKWPIVLNVLPLIF